MLRAWLRAPLARGRSGSPQSPRTQPALARDLRVCHDAAGGSGTRRAGSSFWRSMSVSTADACADRSVANSAS